MEDAKERGSKVSVMRWGINLHGGKRTAYLWQGCATLVQLVFGVMLLNSMQPAKIPTTTIKEMERLQHGFIWGSTSKNKK